MVPYWMVTIQQAADTGLFHPTLYREAPFPGSASSDVARYKSVAHHTEGFVSLWDARADAQQMLQHYGLPTPAGGVQVEQVESAGPNVVLVSAGRSEA